MASPKPKRKPVPKAKADKPQSERFREAAEALCVELSGKSFERAFRAIAPPKRKPKRKTETRTPAK